MGIDQSTGKYRCRSGHNLEYDYSSDGYPCSCFSCDSCHQSYNCSEGRYNCRYCKWDICNNCSNQYKPKPNPVSFCKLGHPLTYNSIYYPGGSYACDMCHRSFPSHGERWCCTSCQYDICPFCRPPCPIPGPFPRPPVPGPAPNPNPYPYDPNPNPYPPYDPNPYNPNPYQPSDDRCPSGHILSPSTDSYGYPGGMYSCDKCHNSYYCGANMRYNCSICKYDICAGCKENPIYQ